MLGAYLTDGAKGSSGSGSLSGIAAFDRDASRHAPCDDFPESIAIEV
jgi:hypothetical protein